MDANGAGDSSSDEENNGMERPEPAELSFTDEGLQASVLGALDMMRRNRYFCDVVLLVAGSEVHAHRAVLAAVSPRLFEMFSAPASANGADGATGGGGVAGGGVVGGGGGGGGGLPGGDSHTATCRVDGVDPVAFRLLVDYAYTGQLRAPFVRVRAIHEAARSLRMERVASECARHLVAHLSPESCVWTRALAGVARDPVLRRRADQYIAAEFGTVRRGAAILALPRLHVDILQRSRHELALVDGDSICRLVLEWARRTPPDQQLFSLNGDSDRDREQYAFLLYVAADNTLRDCRGLPAGDAADTSMVREYKRAQHRRDAIAKGTDEPSEQPRPARPRVLIDWRDAGREPDWAVLACDRVTDRSFVSLATAGGRLCALFVRFRLDEDADAALKAAADETPSPVYRALAPMPGGGRCGVGCAPLAGALLVCGGYDRVECLRTVERYEPRDNAWHKMAPLREPRGRFQAAALSSAVFAAGGSSGTTELASVEVLRAGATTWTMAARLPLARSEAGVCAAPGEDALLCVGGWTGQAPACRQCDRYDATADRWLPAAPLLAGRYQAGVCALGPAVYAAAGCDAWACLRTVERYDARIGTWEPAAHLATARRGCGVAELHGRLYAVGGSDGTRSLSSTEMYDPAADRWMPGPPLTTPRANVAVAAVGDRLYAIGGFCTGSFLDTIEYLDVTTGEWTAFTPDQQ